MCARCSPPLATRRTLLRVAAFASASPLLAAAASPPAPSTAPGVTPDAALRRLRDGNARYVAGRVDARDFSVGRAARAAGQAPFAAVLSCADSRVAPELVFDCGPGDLFVVRNAGNCVEPFGVASLEYAATALGARLILVLGHSGCGAVKAAVATIGTGAEAPGHLPALVNAIRPAIEAAGPSPALDAVIRAHVAQGCAALRVNQPILAPMNRDHRLLVAGAVYDIATGRVAFA